MYTADQLEEILTEKDVVLPAIAEMMGEFLLLCPTLRPKAQEHCQYGIARRLLTLHECLEYFFTELPLDTQVERTRRENGRANIHLHAFLINTSGILDNIAWLWAYQIGLDESIDLEKKKRIIGLFNKEFFAHLPTALALLVEQYTKWYEFLTLNRHPTAHRIPPYVVPYTNPKADDPPDLRNYVPRYIHSFGAKHGLIPLHVQSLADANTVLSLLRTLLMEIRESNR